MNAPQAQNPSPLTVTQLTNAIKYSLESTFPNITLQGEVSNLKIQSSGHLYFSLKDAEAQISAVMFKGNASLLKTMPKGGDQVVVKGELNVYPSKGNYQLIVRELAYTGIGELLQKLEMLKMKIHQMGWFKSARKKPLPKIPKRIGVVTSPTGAVIQDILHVLTRRFSGFHLILNPVKVQGEGAAAEIAQAIAQFNQYQLADVLIVGRGGGSLEDLWAFNEEIVASAIFHSKIPIISAVGHETDHCIADYVADVRAPTPSAAAEIVISEKNQLLDHLAAIRKRFHQTLCHLIQQNQYRLKGILKHPIVINPKSLLERRMQKIDDCRQDIDQALNQYIQLKKHRLESLSHKALSFKPTNQIFNYKQRLAICRRSLRQEMSQQFNRLKQDLAYKRERLDQLWQSQQSKRRHQFNPQKFKQELDQAFKGRLELYQHRLNHVFELLKAVDPKNVLKKGYSILFAENGSSVINSVSKLTKGQQAKLLMSDGEIILTIKEVKHYGPDIHAR